MWEAWEGASGRAGSRPSRVKPREGDGLTQGHTGVKLQATSYTCTCREGSVTPAHSHDSPNLHRRAKTGLRPHQVGGQATTRDLQPLPCKTSTPLISCPWLGRSWQAGSSPAPGDWQLDDQPGRRVVWQRADPRSPSASSQHPPAHQGHRAPQKHPPAACPFSKHHRPPRDTCDGQGTLLSGTKALGIWEPETLSPKRNHKPVGCKIPPPVLQRLQAPSIGPARILRSSRTAPISS